jgi:hypothetical protein
MRKVFLMRTRLTIAALQFAICILHLSICNQLRAVDLTRPLSPLATQGPVPKEITPPTAAEVQSAIERGVDFLLTDQRPEGSWGSAEETKGLNIYAPVPGAHHGFRLAVTGLALKALATVEHQLEGERREKVAAAIDRGEAWMLAEGDRVRRASPDAIYNVWGHAFGAEGLVALHRRAAGDAPRQAKLKAAVAIQIDRLKRYSFVGGGWSYYDFDYGTQVPGDAAFSFCTATGLNAIHEARSIGVEFPQKLVDKALASIYRQQNPDLTYAYGEYLRMVPRYDINRPAGSLGRSQACNYVLRKFGDTRITDEVLTTWLNRLFARNGWLSIGRKRPVPHESYFAVAGYFYYFGHYYAAMAIDELPEPERTKFQGHMNATILPKQEKDGSWWDYPFYNYHRPYGTAMALFAIADRNPTRPPETHEQQSQEAKKGDTNRR